MNKPDNSKGTPRNNSRLPVWASARAARWICSARSEKSKNPRGTLLRLGGYLKPPALAAGGYAVLVIITSLVDLLGPYLMGLAIDSYINKGDLAGLAHLLELMVGTYMIAAAGTWLQAYLMAGVAQRAVRDMRRDLFARLQTLPLRFFDQRSHGELMSRLTNDVDNVSNVLASSFSQLVSSLFGLVGVIIIMFLLNRLLALWQLDRHAADLRADPLHRQTHPPGLPRDPAEPGRAERDHRGDHHRRAHGESLRARADHAGEFCRGQPALAQGGAARPHLCQLYGPA